MRGIKKLLLLIVFVALLTTGCKMKEHVNIKIGSDKKITTEIIMAMDNEMIDAMINMQNMNTEIDEDAETEAPTENKTVTDEERWAYVDESFDIDEMKEKNKDAVIKKYEKDGYKGYSVSGRKGNIDEFSTENATEKTNIGENIEGGDSKAWFIKNGDTYKSNLTMQSEEMQNAASYEQMGAAFDLKLILTLPNKSISNNATEVSEDGLTLTWDLMKTKDIDFEFKFENNAGKLLGGFDIAKYLPYIIGGVALIIIIIVIVVIASKKKKAPSTPLENGPVQDFNKFENNIQPEAANSMNNVNQNFENSVPEEPANQEVNNETVPTENDNQNTNNN